MDREIVLESCKRLVLKCGYNRGNKTDYFDEFGCDFHIKHEKLKARLPEKRDSLEVYLGGRQIYDHIGANMPGHGVRLLETDFDWLNLVDELFLYEIHKYACDELYVVNSSLIEFYRRKAAINRKFLEKYFDIGMALTKEQGLVRACLNNSLNISVHSSTLGIGNHKFSIACRNGVDYDHVSILYDESLVFACYRYDEYGDEYSYEGSYVDDEWKNYLSHYLSA